MQVPMRAAMRGITMDVTITGVRAQAVRVRLAVWLIHLAARLIGCQIDVSMTHKPNML